jgi:hypothetical protein
MHAAVPLIIAYFASLALQCHTRIFKWQDKFWIYHQLLEQNINPVTLSILCGQPHLEECEKLQSNAVNTYKDLNVLTF